MEQIEYQRVGGYGRRNNGELYHMFVGEDDDSLCRLSRKLWHFTSPIDDVGEQKVCKRCLKQLGGQSER